jgi:hypothetical protein
LLPVFILKGITVGCALEESSAINGIAKNKKIQMNEITFDFIDDTDYRFAMQIYTDLQRIQILCANINLATIFIIGSL